MGSLSPRLDVVHHLTTAAKQIGAMIPPETVIVAVQHLLASNVALFAALIELGLAPENAFVIGKGYSTSPAMADALAELGPTVFPNLSAIRPGHFGSSMDEGLGRLLNLVSTRFERRPINHLVVVDDGGRCLSLARTMAINAKSIVGVEQTTSGIRRVTGSSLHFPVIDVARSAAKLRYESPLIAEAVVRKLATTRAAPRAGMVAGVIGLGSIGSTLVDKLTDMGLRVIDYELEEFRHLSHTGRAKSWNQIFSDADVVFGCTGVDLFSDGGLPVVYKSGMALCSCSSEDIEFRGLLRCSKTLGSEVGWPAPDHEARGPSGPFSIIRGGYPVNFDSSDHSVPTEDIQLTTALLLAAVILATQLPPADPIDRDPFIQLPYSLQESILRDWLAISPTARRTWPTNVRYAPLGSLTSHPRMQLVSDRVALFGAHLSEAMDRSGGVVLP